MTSTNKNINVAILQYNYLGIHQYNVVIRCYSYTKLRKYKAASHFSFNQRKDREHQTLYKCLSVYMYVDSPLTRPPLVRPRNTAKQELMNYTEPTSGQSFYELSIPDFLKARIEGKKTWVKAFSELSIK